MLNLTRQERSVILVFFCVLSLGLILTYLAKKIPQVDYIQNLDISSVQKININKASVVQIEKLPGVSAKLAQNIVDFRQKRGGFKSPEELKLIKGIKDKKYEVLKEYLTLE
jgi:competence ComEA-like helix-hairpin-helix protein